VYHFQHQEELTRDSKGNASEHMQITKLKP
jgi:hypothetical protein